MVVTAGELGERSGVPATRLCSTGPASALLDEGMLSAGPTQPDEIDVDVGVGVDAGAVGGERAAAAAAHLERPHDAPPVGRLDARRRDRIELFETTVQGR